MTAGAESGAALIRVNTKISITPGWCAHYDYDALWMQNFQDDGEGREISLLVLSLDRFSQFHKLIFV